MTNEPNYDEIRRRIKRRYDNRAEFLSHLVAFVIVNGLGWWFIALPMGGIVFTLAALVSGLWFLGVVIHFIQFLTKELQERAIEREIERERAWRSSYASEPDMKRKRERLTLTEDGELLEVIEDDEAPPSARRR
jgi:fatty acid desaturase